MTPNEPQIKRILTTDKEVDLNVLRTKCEPFDVNAYQQEIQELIFDLGNVFFHNPAIGISAPQIGVLKRVFLARVFSGVYAFVNPYFTKTSDHQDISVEGCLSCPSQVKAIRRAFSVTLDADTIIKIDRKIHQVKGPFELSGQDAFVVQHEMDHLDGILMTDKPELVLSDQEIRAEQKKEKRRVKLEKSRFHRRNKTKNKETISEKRRKKIEQSCKEANRDLKKRIMIQENYQQQLDNSISAN